ncbi:MAG: hypothetical protein R2824_36200 [Saprospiraceae bacterium]|nr:hypothetical protein [Lewinella sp.]
MESIELTVRVQPSGDEVTIELDVYTSGKEIKKELVAQDIAPSTDNQGNPIVYKLISKSSNKVIDDHKTLDDMEIQEGETLFMVPDLVAG